MADIATTIDNLLKSQGISGAKMCLDLGMSRSFMTELRKGRSKGITAETAHKIANYFGISVDHLLGKEEMPTVTGEQKKHPIETDGMSGKKKSLIYKVMQMSDAELDRLDKILALVEKEV